MSHSFVKLAWYLAEVRENLKMGNCLSKEPLKLSLFKHKLILQAQCYTEKPCVLSRRCFLKICLLLNPALSAIWTALCASWILNPERFGFIDWMKVSTSVTSAVTFAGLMLGKHVVFRVRWSLLGNIVLLLLPQRGNMVRPAQLWGHCCRIWGDSPILCKPLRNIYSTNNSANGNKL